VLAVEGGKVRVQTLAGDPLVADRGDLYLPARAGGSPKVNDYAICRWSANVWVGCQLEAAQGDRVTAINLDGQRRELGADAVLEASQATRMTQARLFERARARGNFEALAQAAGKPRRPPGWHPNVGEKVIARRGERWESAHVGSQGDAGLTVSWSGDDGAQRLRTTDVVPRPPYTGVSLAPGNYVLIAEPAGSATRGAGASWIRVRVESVSDSDVLVMDREGNKHRVPLRELVPLER
jgi:hypothetical protein